LKEGNTNSQIVKKTRGKPKKNSIEVKLSSGKLVENQINFTEQGSTDTQVVKRKVGRPKKNKS